MIRETYLHSFRSVYVPDYCGLIHMLTAIDGQS